MADLSIKKLNWLLVISIPIFITLLIYMATFMVKDSEHSVVKLVNMQFKNVAVTLNESENSENRDNEMINNAFPGLSRGVILKDPSQEMGFIIKIYYPNSMIIEIGGVDNTVEELYRTADVLGYIISQYYWDNLH
jgi:stage II sporulation protein P